MVYTEINHLRSKFAEGDEFHPLQGIVERQAYYGAGYLFGKQ